MLFFSFSFSQSKTSLAIIALIFAAVILRSPKIVAEKYREAVDKKKAAFLAHFFSATPEAPVAS